MQAADLLRATPCASRAAVCFLLSAVLSLAAARAAAAPNGHWRAVLQTPAAGDTTPVLSANNQELPR
jgi:hypothetical protein